MVQPFFINNNDSKVVIEVDYYDTNTPMKMMYNSIVPEGATDNYGYVMKALTLPDSGSDRDWVTDVIRIDDARFSDTSISSWGHLGFGSSGPNFYIKIISVIQADLYD